MVAFILALPQFYYDSRYWRSCLQIVYSGFFTIEVPMEYGKEGSIQLNEERLFRDGFESLSTICAQSLS
jgi:hypothetical protein